MSELSCALLSCLQGLDLLREVRVPEHHAGQVAQLSLSSFSCPSLKSSVSVADTGLPRAVFLRPLQEGPEGAAPRRVWVRDPPGLCFHCLSNEGFFCCV